jgi:hypothetical protein
MRIDFRNRLGAVTATAVVGLLLSSGSAVAQTMVDCDGGGSLQSTIDAAVAGSSIEFTGTCVENLVFGADDEIDIFGTGEAVIDGSGAIASTVTVPIGAIVTFTDVTITGGTGEFGGGIDNSGDLEIWGSLVEFNSATVSGGGIDSLGPLSIIDSIIADNVADSFGGGVVIRDDAFIDTVGIFDNAATDGGGVANLGFETYIFDSAIFGNEATFGLGGGIYNDFESSLFVFDTEISFNETLGGLGGGIYNGDGAGGGGGDVFLQRSVFSLNGAGGGGGFYNEGGVLLAIETIFSDHLASAGGAITNTLGGATTLLDSQLVGNSGSTGGGAIFSDSGTVQIFSTTLSGNVADGLAVGGAILNTGDSALLVDDSTLSGNTADSGGAIYNESPATVNLFDSTVAGNTATGAATGGGVYNDGGSVLMSGTIVADNVSATGPDCAGTISSGGYNLIEDVTGCGVTPLATDLTGIDPVLGPLADNGGPNLTHALLPGSPAIDHVPPGPFCGGGDDQRGIVRPRGAGCDIGAFEADNEPDVVLLVEPSGLWHIRQEGVADRTFWFGAPGDVPLFGDWDGDGIDTPGMWRPGAGGGFAYLTNTLPEDGAVEVAEFDFFFGNPGDEVFSGDWDGDGIDTLGINRGGHIFLSDSNGSFGDPVPTDYDFWFGVLGDRAFGGDPDGDGKDSVLLYRAADGYVYYTNETPTVPGAVATTADFFYFGISSDSFVGGDWDGDMVDTAGIFRGSNTTVYLSNSNASDGAPAPTDDSYVWGTAGWTPVAGVWE